MMRTLITVPMKDPQRAKTRLANALEPTARARLAALRYRRTLEVLLPVAETTGAALCVGTASETVAAIAQAMKTKLAFQLTKSATMNPKPEKI